MIETKRLLLRRWKDTDLLPFIDINQDHEVMRYFPNLLTAKEVTDMYGRIENHFTDWGYGLFAVEIKESAKFIGFVGLSHPRFESEFTPCVEIGWRIARSSWNKGYATEAAKEVLRYSFESLSIEEIYSFTALENTPSCRVMEKIGMKKIGEFDHPNLPETSPLRAHHLYHITSNSASQ